MNGAGSFRKIRKFYLYFLPNSKLKKKFEKTLEERLEEENVLNPVTLEEMKKAYNICQTTMDEFFGGIDAGRNLLFLLSGMFAFGYYGVGLAKNVADFSQIGIFKPIYKIPGIKNIAEGVENSLHYLAERISYSFPHYDKAGHVGVGLLIGRAVEAVADWCTETKFFRKHYKDVDDVAQEKRKSFFIHLGLQATATAVWASWKENFVDVALGGVKSVFDYFATIGGQVVNGIMGFFRAKKYSVIINSGRKKMWELGMDDDGNPIRKVEKFQDVYVPISATRKFRKAFKEGEWKKYVRKY